MNHLILCKIDYRSVGWLILLTMVGPLTFVTFVLTTSRAVDLSAVILITVITGVTLAVLGAALTRRKVIQTEMGLIIYTTFYKRLVARGEVKFMHRIDLTNDEDVIGGRYYGVRLPGYRSGWFRPRSIDNCSRIFVDVAGKSYVLITLSDHSQIALSFKDDELAWEELRSSMLASNAR